jgi:hypothetical protein
MKSETPIPRKSGNSRRHSGTGLSHLPLSRLPLSRLPMEWMDPLSWRLPSGQALAEFALQTGFLAPLLMKAPRAKRKPETAEEPLAIAIDAGAGKSSEGLEEAPARLASFRHNR